MGRAKKAKAYQLKEREKVHIIEEEPMIMSPTARMVDNPDWDPNAPEVELDERVIKAKAAQRMRDRARARIKRTVTSTPQLLAFLGGGLLAVAAVGFGVHYMLEQQDLRAQAQTQAQIEAERAARAKAEADAVAEAALNKKLAQAFYRTRIELASEELKVVPLSIDELRKPNSFAQVISHSAPAVLTAGRPEQYGALRFEVYAGTMSVERQTIHSKGAHTTLTVTNTGEHALAYLLNMRKAEGGECKSPAIMNYDALVLDGGKSVEISVCSGRHSVEIIDLRTLELTALGAAWVRQLPAKAVGLEGVTARAHQVSEDIHQCGEDAAQLARELSEDLIRWEDIVDFYSRHDCNDYAWWSGYRLATRPLAELPVLAPGTTGPTQ